MKSLSKVEDELPFKISKNCRKKYRIPLRNLTPQNEQYHAQKIVGFWYQKNEAVNGVKGFGETIDSDEPNNY